MDYLTEEDYSELIDYLILGLEKYHADDIIRQIKELETVNIIEETRPATTYAARKPPGLDQADPWKNAEIIEEMYSTKWSKKADKKLEREAVSEYSSRPMSCKEMYYASIDILETYLLSVPKILESIEEKLDPENFSNIIWKNEGERHMETAHMNIIEAVGRPEQEIQKKIEEIINALKSVPEKENA